MNTVRVNITLPMEIAQMLRNVKNKSAFIAEAIRRKEDNELSLDWDITSVMELIKRGDIYWIRLDPIQGFEIGKTRPAVVISNDINNELADTITVLPVTPSVGKVYPFEVFLK